jgi:hypothetical protein
MNNTMNDQLADACKRLDNAIKNNASNARRIAYIAPKGATLLVHVNYALDDMRRLDNARY